MRSSRSDGAEPVGRCVGHDAKVRTLGDRESKQEAADICMLISDPTCSFRAISGNGAVISRSVDEDRLRIDTVWVGVSYFFNSSSSRGLTN